jgi:hypothetical protein
MIKMDTGNNGIGGGVGILVSVVLAGLGGAWICGCRLFWSRKGGVKVTDCFDASLRPNVATLRKMFEDG